MATGKKIVEPELGVKVPEDYAAFLDEYGMHESDGVEL
jgi:hypothetical protein